MSFAAPSTCILCRHQISPWSRSLVSRVVTWQSSRSMAQAQRSRPSRLTLSPKVARQVERNLPSGKPVRKSTNSPFGGMNRKSANINRLPDKRSSAELKRSSGIRERQRSQGREERGNTDTFKALKMQRALAPVSYKERTNIKERILEVDTFDTFNLLPEVKDSIATQALDGLEEITPTPIQRIAIPAFLGQQMGKRRSRKAHSEDMEQFLIAAETGSGKTLAYLVPVIDAIKRAELSEAEQGKESLSRPSEKYADPSYVEPPPLSDQPHHTTNRPKAIILVPTSELVSQVGALAKAFTHTVKFRSAHVSSALTGKVIRNRLFNPNGIDLVISTPHLLSSIAESDPNILSRVTHLVIDEADSLLDRSFALTTSAIIDKATPSLQQLILCSATIPRSLDSFLRKRFPNIRRLVTPNLHAIPRRVQLGVVDVERDPYRNNKLLACADTIYTIGKAAAEHSETHAEKVEVKRILVFVNEREKTVEVADYLQSKGIDASPLNRDTPEQRQSELLASFTAQKTEASSSSAESSPDSVDLHSSNSKAPNAKYNYTPAHKTPDLPTSRRSLANTKVLVTTDLGSRGIDTTAVRHVILYDVPHSTIDFIHRLGRTGRMGRRGRGIILVGKGDRKDVVAEVREGMFRGQALI